MNNVGIWLVFGNVQTLTLTGSIFLRLTHRVIGFLHFEDNTWYLYLLTLKPSDFHAHSKLLFRLASLLRIFSCSVSEFRFIFGLFFVFVSGIDPMVLVRHHLSHQSGGRRDGSRGGRDYQCVATRRSHFGSGTILIN